MQGSDATECFFSFFVCSLGLIFLFLFYLSISLHYNLLYHFLLIMSACFLNLLLVHRLFGRLVHKE